MKKKVKKSLTKKKKLKIYNYFLFHTTAKHGLLVIILSLIYMNNEVIKTDTLELFLEKMKLNFASGRKDRSRIGDAIVDPSMVTLFGDVKNLIDKDWVKHRYLTKIDVDLDDPNNPQSEYRWGERAKKEFDKKDILNFVAKIYEKPVKAFSDQYQMIGPHNFVEETSTDQSTDEAMETQ